MKKPLTITTVFLIFSTLSCKNENSENANLSINQEQASTENQSTQHAETEEMVRELKRLVDYGNPKNYYNWNHARAELYKEELAIVAYENSNAMFYNYCFELLLAGETRTCINEIDNYFKQWEEPLEAQLNENTYVLFELLALAYLRLGEQENCQAAHTEFSCILPLQAPGLHRMDEGSRKAIELFTMLQDYFSQEKYKWLLNVAYMTLGEHPNQVPTAQRLTYPNWKLEQKNFPRFNEIGMNVGLAENGLSGGTCFDDFNGDGLLDVFATSSGISDQVKLLLNTGKGDFEDATATAGLIGITGGLNCTHADYDNDGNMDIFILRGAWFGENGKQPNSLLKNNGDGTFDDVTRSAGLLSYHPTQTAAWGDFNKDGYLDLFIGNESESAPHPCELYKNNGDGTFKEVSTLHGLGNITQFVKGVTWGDINNDGWPDLYISLVRGKNLLYKNTEGQFTEIAEKAGVSDPFYSFPCWFFDANNDGFEDLFVCAYDLTDLASLAGDFALELQGKTVLTNKPHLYINNGDETFSDQSEAYGISKTMYGMGANFGDLDNDGFLDFYIGTGAPEYQTIVPNRMFRNVGGKRFEEVTSAGGFGHIQKGHGIAFADIDRDGDQDIYAVMGGVYEGDQFTNVLFENPGFNTNWIILELDGVTTNKSAVGTRLELILDNGQTIYRTVGTGGSFGASSLQQEIGLGKANSIKTLTINWQNGAVQIVENIASNQKLHITEGKQAYTVVPYAYIPFAIGTGEHHHH